MKKRRLFSLFLSFALLLPLFSLTSADAYEDFTLDAKAGLLIEADTGEILYEKNAHQENFPASLTKVMVALLVFEAIDEGKIALTDSVTATESAFEGLSSDGSTANIVPGETMTVEQLLNCMLIVSANEACNILAEAVCGEGNISQFVQRMNERAAALGCENTHYVNTSGLHDPDHYTTAWDIYLITRALMPYEKFMEICNSKSAEIAETDHNQRHVLHSTNRLISNWRELGYLYRDAQGIKTGSTEESGYCLVSSAKRSGRRLVAVVLGCKGSGATVEKTFTMPEVPVRESSETKRQNAALHQRAEAPSICAKSAPTPAAMMTNIPKRKNSCSSPTASRRSGIGRRITRASVWSQPVCCTSRSSNTPKKKESATASSRPAIPCQPKQPKNLPCL